MQFPHLQQIFITFCVIFVKRDLTRSLTVDSETGLETKIQQGARTGGT